MLFLTLLSATIHGMVVDAETGNLLVGAAVVVEGRGAGTYTDDRGHFMLMNVPPPPLVLVVSMVGYDTKRLELSEIPSHLSVGLNPLAIGSQEIEIISSPTLHDMSQSPLPTQKIDLRRIEKANQTSLLDAVRLMPGVTVPGGTSSGSVDAFNPRLQGLLSRHTLVLYDGKRLFCHDGTGSNISSVPLLLVERFEIIEGASCAIHGSDALGGIVNIITKKPASDPFYAFRANYGSYGSAETGAGFGAAGPAGSSYILSVAQRSYEGRYDAESYRRLGASFKFAWKGFRFNGDYSEGSVGQTNPEDFWNGIGEAGFSYMTGFSHNDLNAYFNNYYRTYGSRSAQSGTAELRAESHIARSFHNLMLGGVIRLNRFERTGLSLVSEPFYGVYFEDDARPAGWFNLDIAGRADVYPVGGLQITPKAGFKLKPGRGLSFRAYVGRGYRSPSLQERYEELVPSGSSYKNGNPDIRSESSISLSAGTELAPFAFLNISLSGFYNSIKDMLVPWPTGDSLNGLPVFTSINIPRAYTWGLSPKLRVEGGPLWAEIAYTYLRSRNAETGFPVDYEPTHTIAGQATVEYRRSGVSLTGEWVRGRTYGAGNRLPDYALLNLNIFASPLKGLQVNLGAQNLLGKEIEIYEEGSVSASPGRTLNGGINLRF